MIDRDKVRREVLADLAENLSGLEFTEIKTRLDIKEGGLLYLLLEMVSSGSIECVEEQRGPWNCVVYRLPKGKGGE